MNGPTLLFMSQYILCQRKVIILASTEEFWHSSFIESVSIFHYIQILLEDCQEGDKKFI